MNNFRKVVKGPHCNVVQTLRCKFFIRIYCKRLKKNVVKVTKKDN